MGSRRNLEDQKRSFRPVKEEEEDEEEEEEEEDEDEEEEEESESKRIRAARAANYPPPGKRYAGSSSGTRSTAVVSSSSSSARASICQADNCNVDMTEAKKYHRRHKVCEFHAKAPVVFISGARQRFCQQCSRFHELSEFDDTKRSCRRRLAGHNERRRKSSCDYPGDG